MSEGESIRFPHQAVFDEAAGKITSGHDPMSDIPNQIAELGLPALLVGMWPTGVELAVALGAALGTAALAHQNHSTGVQNAVTAISAAGKNYHNAEQQNCEAITRLRPAAEPGPGVQV